jgi:hypothetical protein
MNENDSLALNSKQFAIMEFNLTETSSDLCKICPDIVNQLKNSDHLALFLVILLVFVNISALLLTKLFIKSITISISYIASNQKLELEQYLNSRLNDLTKYIEFVISDQIPRKDDQKDVLISMTKMNYALFKSIDFLSGIETFFHQLITQIFSNIVLYFISQSLLSILFKILFYLIESINFYVFLASLPNFTDDFINKLSQFFVIIMLIKFNLRNALSTLYFVIYFLLMYLVKNFCIIF